MHLSLPMQRSLNFAFGLFKQTGFIFTVELYITCSNLWLIMITVQMWWLELKWSYKQNFNNLTTFMGGMLNDDFKVW